MPRHAGRVVRAELQTPQELRVRGDDDRREALAIAPTAMGRSIPHGTRTPAAIGMAMTLRRAREHGRVKAQPLLGVMAPDDDREGQDQAQPELVAEHRDGVAGVPIVAAGGCGFVVSMGGVVHLQLRYGRILPHQYAMHVERFMLFGDAITARPSPAPWSQ